MKLLGLIPILWSCMLLNAQQNDLKFKILDKVTNDPLFGAAVYIPYLKLGSSADIDGMVTFFNVPEGNYQLSISFLGYETTELIVEVPQADLQTIYLNPDEHQLEEVLLQSSRSTRTVKKIPTRIEFIGGEELEEKAMMNSTNISMVLRESTGIQMQQTSLSSGNANIRIQGLDGRYTQILRDGFPLYGGFSSGLSIMQIPPLDLKQFEIIKGSASTLYGGGAIAGLVNLVSKRPEEEPSLEIMFTQTQALGSTGNIFYSAKKDK